MFSPSTHPVSTTTMLVPSWSSSISTPLLIFLLVQMFPVLIEGRNRLKLNTQGFQQKGLKNNLPLHQVYHHDARLSCDFPHLPVDRVYWHDSSPNQDPSRFVLSAHALPNAHQNKVKFGRIAKDLRMGKTRKNNTILLRSLTLMPLLQSCSLLKVATWMNFEQKLSL